MSRRAERTPWLTALALPGAIWLAALVALPALATALISLASRGPFGEPVPPWGLHNYALLLTDPLFARVLTRSLLLGAGTTLLCALVGYPLAFHIAASRRQTLWLLAITIPFFVNFLIRVYAWMLLLQKEGLVNAAAALLGAGPFALLPSALAVWVATVYTFLPFFVLPVYAVVERIDWTLRDAALDLGAPPLRAFTAAVLPQTLPGLAAGAALVFVPAAGTFVIADLLGGGKITLIGNLIQLQFGAAQHWPLGAAASTVLMALALLGLAVCLRAFGAREGGR
ncbi:MAG: spermidine/putrescine ABC transporter permease [Porticoccaceae bacterium]|nr:MAG: spermidine/putrescine ABC transporter permease [Porticoccaceae bacterium]